MERKLTRAVATLTAFAAVALAGGGEATARGLDGGPSQGTGTAVTIRTTAAEVQALHNRLQSAADAGDVPAVESTLAAVDPELAKVVDGARRVYTASSVSLATTARQESADAAKAVAELPQQTAARDLPPVAGLLNALLQRLLLSLSSLVNDLLGGLTLPAR